jgi:hypothetical protein
MSLYWNSGGAYQFEPLMMALRLSLGYQSLGTYWDAS